MSSNSSPTTAPTESSDAFLAFIIIIVIVVFAFVVSIVVWGFWKYRKIKSREIERCSNCRCDTLEEHQRCNSCDIPPTEAELKEAEENLIYHRCPCIPPWRSRPRTTKIAVNGGPTLPPSYESAQRQNGFAKSNGAKQITPIRVNGSLPKGGGGGGGYGKTEETLTKHEERERRTADASPDRTSADNGTISEVARIGGEEAEEEELPARGNSEGNNHHHHHDHNHHRSSKQRSTNPSSRRTSSRWEKSSRPDAGPEEEEKKQHSPASNSVPPLELKCLNEESSDVDRGKKRSVVKGEERRTDDYVTSEEEISTPRKPTVIHIGKSGVTIGGSNENGAASPRIQIGGNGSISLGNSTISLGGGTGGSRINLGSHLGGSTITIDGGEMTDGKLAPKMLKIGSKSSRRSGRYDGKHFYQKSRHHSHNSGRSSAGSRCSTQISFSNGMTLMLTEEEGDGESPRGQTRRSKIKTRHESHASYRRRNNDWSRHSERGRHVSTREENGEYHHHHHPKMHPYRGSTARENSKQEGGGEGGGGGSGGKIYTTDQTYSPQR